MDDRTVEEVYQTPAELAREWCCSPSLIRKLIAQGDLAAHRVGTNYIVPASAKRAYLARTRLEAKAA